MSFFLHIFDLPRWYFQSVENLGEVMFHQHVFITSFVLFCKMPNEVKNSPRQTRKKYINYLCKIKLKQLLLAIDFIAVTETSRGGFNLTIRSENCSLFFHICTDNLS